MITLIIAAVISNYGKGFIKNLPFLFAILITYCLASITTALHNIPLVNFAAFDNVHLIQIPDFSFFHMNFINFDWWQSGN